jgi:hypothetical protein
MVTASHLRFGYHIWMDTAPVSLIVFGIMLNVLLMLLIIRSAQLVYVAWQSHSRCLFLEFRNIPEQWAVKNRRFQEHLQRESKKYYEV